MNASNVVVVAAVVIVVVVLNSCSRKRTETEADVAYTVESR